jgi:hypothetical protein
MIFIIVVMSLIQISVWQMFPKKLRDILFSNPVFSFTVNLVGSSLIAAFTGIASIVGICNMGASVIFGLYGVWYQKTHNIKGLGLDSYRLWNFIPICPRIMVVYQKGNKIWRE